MRPLRCTSPTSASSSWPVKPREVWLVMLPVRGSMPARSRPAAGFGVVIGTSDASSPDPPHRGHALLIAGVIAGHRPARFGVDRTPWIIIGGLGGADIGTDQQDDTAEYQRIDFQAHLDLPIPP